LTDFWFNVSWTLLIAVIAATGDWIGGRLVAVAGAVSAIRKAADHAATTDRRKLREIRSYLDRLALQNRAGPIWGVDLALVATSMDFAALGIWVSNHGTFPFFSRWNTSVADRETAVWLTLLLAHIVALLVAIVFKHLHLQRIGDAEQSENTLVRNRWMIASNALGFTLLLSTITILTNSF
jgi:hypothetical protein